MARNETWIDASVEDVFAVLLDAEGYQDWVVGAKNIRAVDADWPQRGSAFHHQVGVGPLNLKDSTMVLAIDRPRYLLLQARALPAGVAHVSFKLAPRDGGTHLTMEEHVVSGPAARFPNPLLDGMTHLRNMETLRRLKRRAEERPSTRRGD